MPPGIAAAPEIEGTLAAIMNERNTLEYDWMICPKLISHEIPTEGERALTECFTTTEDWMRMVEEATSRNQALIGVFATFRNVEPPGLPTGSSSPPKSKMMVWAVVYRDIMEPRVVSPRPSSQEDTQEGTQEDEKKDKKEHTKEIKKENKKKGREDDKKEAKKGG